MLGELIWRRWGGCYNPRYLSSLLAKLGLEETWPAILKQAQAQGAVILFADEVSFALWGSLSRTWAPRGQQPVVKKRGGVTHSLSQKLALESEEFGFFARGTGRARSGF